MNLLEREEPLADLCRALQETRDRGRLIAVYGEAGIGKSSLLREFARRGAGVAPFFWGRCDALKTPSPLGPLVDIATALRGVTARRLDAGAPRHELFAAIVDDLESNDRPPVIVIEDAHWADEATIDLLKYVGHRIDRTRALIIVTWRDDEVDLDHPIHRVLGDWRPETTLRIPLRPLSVEAVTTLVTGGRDATAVHAVTGGNPFFVTELLSARDTAVPITVRDAVLTRRAALSPDARAVVDFVSIVPSRAEFTLLDAAIQPSAEAIERAIAAGLLGADTQAVAFRHELARIAVAGALPPSRAHHYHRLVLEALLRHPDRTSVLARIVHHADACGAVEAILEHGPAAARQAARLGAHLQAVDHFRRTLEYSESLPDEQRAALRESYAYELYVTGDMSKARQQQRAALELWQRLGVTLAIGRSLRWLSRLSWFDGDRGEAEECANDAITVLTAIPATEELAMAYSNRSQLDMLGGDAANSLAWGIKAIDLARQLGSVDVLTHALNNVGTARAESDRDVGLAQLEESLELALTNDFHEHAARAFTNLSTREVTARRYPTARVWLDRGIAYTSERDLEAWRLYMQAWRARVNAETGAWAAAETDAAAVLAMRRPTIISRITALTAVGLIHVRRGDADAMAILDEALALARPTRETARIFPLLAARAEAAWLAGRADAAEAAAFEGLELPTDREPLLSRSRLTYFLWKLNAAVDLGLTDESPHARLMRGDWQSAAEYWRDIGCPYEHAEALMEGDVTAVKCALELFETLGATPAAAWAGQRLRQLGAGRRPRGRRASTREHPAGLTARESEILAMLARNLGNPEIAARLFVSRKTIEHHVSAILGKLGVSSREDAVALAITKGWISTTP